MDTLVMSSSMMQQHGQESYICKCLFSRSHNTGVSPSPSAARTYKRNWKSVSSCIAQHQEHFTTKNALDHLQSSPILINASFPSFTNAQRREFKAEAVIYLPGNNFSACDLCRQETHRWSNKSWEQRKKGEELIALSSSLCLLRSHLVFPKQN